MVVMRMVEYHIAIEEPEPSPGSLTEFVVLIEDLFTMATREYVEHVSNLIRKGHERAPFSPLGGMHSNHRSGCAAMVLGGGLSNGPRGARRP